MDYTLLKLTVGSLATIGLYSVLYKENKLFRFFEHLFLGLAAGNSIVVIWRDLLAETWYDKMLGMAAHDGVPAVPGYYLYALLVPIALMGYTVFSRKHNWMSRVPIGIFLGMAGGQAFQAFWTTYSFQIADSMKPIIPTTWSSFGVPDASAMATAQRAEVISNLYPSQALNNLIFLITLVSVFSYFIFSVDFKSKLTVNSTKLGRWLLMIGFGAIFGSTVLMRFTLLIDRMYFVFIEWLQQGIFHRM